MIKLKCLGSRPFGRGPIFVEEILTAVRPGETIDGRDATWSSIIMAKYPGCFELVQEVEKAKPNKRDKMLATAKEKAHGFESERINDAGSL